MLCFDIRSLEARAEVVDGWLDAGDSVWEAGESRPVDPGVHVTGRLSAAGHGRCYFSGHFEGTALAECRRCLAEASVSVSDDVQLIFAESGVDEAGEDDVVVIPAGVRELDLRPAMREEWLLAVPSFALCRDDCRGLCPACGADRNAGDCTCPPPSDPRWDALRALR
ncbi:MAG: YceD family protein [Gemmatimonas sp.]